jgi:hypothetical protein
METSGIYLSPFRYVTLRIIIIRGKRSNVLLKNINYESKKFYNTDLTQRKCEEFESLWCQSYKTFFFVIDVQTNKLVCIG